MLVRRLLLAVMCAAGEFHASLAFFSSLGPLPTSRIEGARGTPLASLRQRQHRTRLFESIRGNREKIGRAMNRLRDATRSGDDELAERLKAFIMHLRGKDPQFSTQDAMDKALDAGLFSTAAKLKLKLEEINQNPFRQGLLDSTETADDGGGGGGDISEDMSWGFDQTFFGEEGDGDDEPDDYDDI